MKKILLSSDCNGQFQHLFAKVAQLHTKNNFDLMLLTGNVCSIEATKQFQRVVSGDIKVPIPTFFIDSSKMAKILHSAYPDGKQLAPNFHFLGPSGTINIQGLEIAFVSGQPDHDSGIDLSKKLYKGEFYTSKDMDVLLQKCQGKRVDILMSNQWPKQMNSKDLQSEETIKSTLMSKVCFNLSPKYHLAASGKIFYRMMAFQNQRNSFTHFVNVAEMKRDSKDKYLLAIQTTPYNLDPPEEKVANYVQNPFDPEKHRKSQKEHQVVHEGWGQTGFITEEKTVGFKDSLKSKKQQVDDLQEEMVNSSTYVHFSRVPFEARNVDIQEFLERWGQVVKLEVFKQYKGKSKEGIVKFREISQTKSCLSDSGKYSLYESRIKFKPKSIEQKYSNEDCWFCYKNEKFDRSLLALKAKYCLVCLDKGPICEFHLQIIPINHVDNTGRLEEAEAEQIQMIKRELSKYFQSKGYESIIYERHMRLSEEINHCLIQFIALKQPKSLVHRFQQINISQNLRFEKVSQKSRKSQYFIRVDINGSEYVRQIYGKQKVEFDLMRKVVCELGNLPEKINWRSCERKTEDQTNKARRALQAILEDCGVILKNTE